MGKFGGEFDVGLNRTFGWVSNHTPAKVFIGQAPHCKPAVRRHSGMAGVL